MNTKHLILLTLVAEGMLFSTAAHASPLVSIGDNADLFFDGSASVKWTSNVFRDEDVEVDDLIFKLSPGAELNVGRGLSNADLSITTRYDISRYADQDQLDNETFHIAARGTYRGSRLDLSGRASFDESKSTTGDGDNIKTTTSLIESETVRARVDGEYRFSPKFSFGAGVDYSDREYTNFKESFADREKTSLPLDLFYELTPKVDLSAGYTYAVTDITNRPFAAPDYKNRSHYFNVGARGNLLPKLNGFFKVGYRQYKADLPGSDSNGMLGLDADLAWTATPKLTTKLGLSRDSGVGGAGGTTENTSLNLSATYSIDTNWSASANASYTLREYQTIDNREDNQYRAGLRASYVLNQHWRFSGGYSYTENDSNLVNRSYTDHTFDLSASLRY